MTTPLRRGACTTCGKDIHLSRSSAAKPRCQPCRRSTHDHNGYQRGCRCPTCRAAVAEWMRNYAARRRAEGRPIRRSRPWVPPDVDKTCEHCGADFTVKDDRTRFCSLRCAKWFRLGYSPSQELVHVGPAVGDPRPTVAPVTVVTSPKWWSVLYYGPCEWCGESFTSVSKAGKYCSRRCARQSQNRRSGRFVVAPRVRSEIYGRDGWTCQICGEAASREFDVSDPWSPTLDHVVPRSQGGSDDPSNLRLAHYWCNAVRGDLSYYTDEDLQEVAV